MIRRRLGPGSLGFLALPCVIAAAWFGGRSVAGEERPVAAFSTELETVLPGSPEEIYDAITGDISDWWDHTFSETPERLFVEPTPGGGFWEIFDASGDGVRHATVIAAHRGKLLRFDGPLGFAGHATQIVTTYRFEPVVADSTRLRVTVRAAGELEPEWTEALESVWDHFIFERFVPYVESGRHREGTAGRSDG